MMLRHARVLERLTAPDFGAAASRAATGAAKRRVLLGDSDVVALIDGLRSGAINTDDIRRFVEELLSDFHVGEPFEGDIALAAIAVALEHWHNPYSAAFVDQLSSIQSAELPAATSVAREVRSRRGVRTVMRQEPELFQPKPAEAPLIVPVDVTIDEVAWPEAAMC